MFHYAPFRNESCPTWAEAESRFVYGAWNVYRVDAGNPHFGPGTYCATMHQGNPASKLVGYCDSGFAGAGWGVFRVVCFQCLVPLGGERWFLAFAPPPKPLVSVRVVQAPTPFAII